MHRRVVVTGLGMLTPLGCGVDVSWQKLISGASGIRKTVGVDLPHDFPSLVSGQIQIDGDSPFNVNDWMDAKSQRRLSKFIHYSICASKQAYNDAKLESMSEESKQRASVIIGSGIGGILEIEHASLSLNSKGFRSISPTFLPSILTNSASGALSMEFGFQGANYSTVSACASSAHAIIEGVKLIRSGESDIVIAGGTESSISSLGLSGFAVMRALSSKFNNNPELASRPYDAERNGFVMSEGAGTLIIESLESAKARNVMIHAEIIGIGSSSDAYHMTSPDPEGYGAQLAMKRALSDSGINPDDVDYINAHATSTAIGDTAELMAIEKVFGSRKTEIMVSANKSSTGHLLGASGAVESIFAIKTLQDGIVPATLNLNNPDPKPSNKIDLVPKVAKEKKCKIVLSNSFGFGGTNASIIFKKFDS